MPSSDWLSQKTNTEPDCYWPPDTLDLEPEECFCLRCGEALPCPCHATRPTLSRS